ncbi:MAG: hypothetical protein [Inoviridae sp.]|nr:MAG: hypothetical protein [Inoviridae sp.]
MPPTKACADAIAALVSKAEERIVRASGTPAIARRLRISAGKPLIIGDKRSKKESTKVDKLL